MIAWATAAGTRTSAILRVPSSRISAEQVATNAIALTVTAQHGVPAPRLIAHDVDGRAAGIPASLETVVAGRSTWPRRPSRELFASAGQALARLHTVGFVARKALPMRSRPIAEDDFARERREGRMVSTPLLDEADERVRSMRAPAGRQVLVHGDVWPGNTLIIGQEVHALIDWKGAGVGHPGVDIGELRKQVAILFGEDAAHVVLEGWQRASGEAIDDVPYWDAVAALNTPTECWGPDSAIRRDQFLRAAIARM